MQFFDSHVHLADRQFAADRAQVLEAARAAGLVGWIEVGYSRATIPAALQLAASEKGCYAAVGLHPGVAHESTPEDLAFVSEQLTKPGVVALGEIGLDVHAEAPWEVQETYLRQQLALARAARLPVIFHCRDAYDRLMPILVEEHVEEIGGVLHCFGGDTEALAVALRLGLSIGLGGVATFRNATSVAAIATSLPLESLLLETDAPYLAPHPLRGKRNEPAYLRHIITRIAALRGMEEAELAEQTMANTRKRFGI